MRIEEKNWRKSYHIFSWLCKYLVFFILLGTLLSVVSCKTFFKRGKAIPPDLSSYSTALFSGGVVLIEKNKKHYFSGDIFISRENIIRIDLSATFGIPVFTMLWNKNNVTLLFLREKEFYKGPNIKAFFPSFSALSFSPALFKEVFFDRKPAGKTWTCKMDEKGLPLECQDSLWLIKWERGKKRLLSLKSSDFHFTFRYSLFSHPVDDNLFEVKIPQDFKPLLWLK